MTPAEWIGSAAAVFAALCTIATMLYTRGKLDAHASVAGQKIDALGHKIDALEMARLQDGENKGAQSVLNLNAATAARDARNAQDLASKVEERQTAHEKGCDRRQEAIEARFDKVDRQNEHLATEIRNLALGIANSVTHVPANRRAGP